MPSQGARTAMLLSGVLMASMADLAPAAAQNLPASAAEVAFADLAGERGVANAPSLDLNVRDEAEGRFADLNQFSTSREAANARRAVEFEIGADHDLTGIPVDVSIAQRASFGATEEGDINSHSRGSEVRIGRALGDPESGMTTSESRIYVFAASDNEALHWRPGQDNSLSLQRDTVQVGDRQAGVTYQRGPVQASLAYVEREISAQVGRHSHSENEQFAGFTLTMKN
ncbi:MAG: hypothetical protein NW206_13560 [Hyphomonadaceae bacterium]|nr:hypothetical protein [Hyphomonadaceae bacterium]